MDTSLDGDTIADDADPLRRQPTMTGPIFVSAGRMETAEQHFARTEAARGMRIALDEALAAARDALDADLSFIARAAVVTDMALVRAALSDIRTPTDEALAACRRLERMGMAARVEAETRELVLDEARSRQTAAATIERARIQTAEVEARRDRIRAIYTRMGWPLDKARDVKRIAAELGVSQRTVYSDMEILFAVTSSLQTKR